MHVSDNLVFICKLSDLEPGKVKRLCIRDDTVEIEEDGAQRLHVEFQSQLSV